MEMALMLNLTEKSIRASILRAVRKLDPSAKKSSAWGFKVHNEEVPVEIREDSSQFARVGTGMWRVAVGNYLRAHRFVTKIKDFDYAAIAAAVVYDTEQQKLSRKHEREVKRARSAFEKTEEYKVLEALGVDLYDHTDHSSVEILKRLSRSAFEELVKACDVK